MIKKSLSIIILFFVWGAYLKSQDSTWKMLYPPSSFSNNPAIRDSNLYWIGTDYGLIKYNSINYKIDTFNTSNSSLPHNNIKEIILDEKNELLLIVSENNAPNKLVKFDKVSNWQVIDISVNYIKNLTLKSNNVIIFSNQETIYQLNNSTLDSLSLSDPLSAYFDIYDIAVDSINNIWVSTRRGLYKCDIDKKEKQVVKYIKCNKLAKDITNKLWIGTQDSGLYIMQDESHFISINTDNSNIPSNNIRSINFDLNNNLWINTPEGIAKNNGTNWSNFSNIGSSVLASEIYHFTSDSNSIFFIWEGSLVNFDGENTNSFIIGKVKQGLITNYISSMTFDNSGKLWIDNNMQDIFLQSYKNGKWENYQLYDTVLFNNMFSKVYSDDSIMFWSGNGILIKLNLSSNDICEVSNIEKNYISGKIKVDNIGAIWEASEQGLVRYFKGIKTIYSINNSNISTNSIARVVFDRQNNLYCSSLPDPYTEKGEFIKYDGESFKTIYTCKTNGYWVSSMAFDSHNSFWLGVLRRDIVGKEFGGGLLKIENGNYEYLDIYNSSLSSNSVVVLDLDKNDNLIIGSIGGGLDFFNGETWINYNTSNSIIDHNSIEFITSDSFGNIAFFVRFFGLGLILNQNNIAYSNYTNDQKIPPIVIFPNPVKSDFYAKLNMPHSEIIEANIFDVSGKLIQNLSINTQLKSSTLYFRIESDIANNQVLFLGLKTNKKSMIYSKFLYAK